jgi:hypothetical protein
VIVQVGTNLHVEHARADETLSADLAHLKEHLLALIDLDVGTKKSIALLGDEAAHVRETVARLADATAEIVTRQQVTTANLRGLLELAVHHVEQAGRLRPSLLRWVTENPITQNVVASALFEILKGMI